MRRRSSRLAVEAEITEYAYSHAGRASCGVMVRARATVTDTSRQHFNKRTGWACGERSGGDDHPRGNAGRLLIRQRRLVGQARRRVSCGEGDDGAAEAAA